MTKIFNYFVLLIFIITRILVSKASVITHADNKVVKDIADDGNLQLFYIEEKVGLLQISNSNYRVTGEFQNGINATAVDYHYPRDLIVWSTTDGKIYSCPLKGSRKLAYTTNVKLIYQDKKWKPSSLAIDYKDDRIYVLDTGTNSLRIIDLNGEGLLKILSVPRRSYRPSHLEIDAERGFVFLVDAGDPAIGRYTHILRMRMDGTEAKIIEPPPINIEILTGLMTLDRINKKILLSSRSQKRIYSFDYDGKNLKSVLESQNGTSSMSVTKDELFWVNTAYYRQNEVFKDGSVYRCEYSSSQGCRINSTRLIHQNLGADFIKSLRAVEPLSQRLSEATKQSCPHKCEHFCLNGSCACKTGWKFTSDGKSCEAVDEFLIYEDEKVVRGVCLGLGFDECQPIEPFAVELRLRKKERAAFDYDPTTRKLYYGGKKAIYRVDIDTGEEKRLLYQRGIFFGPLALDWVTKNIYYTEIETRGSISYYILKVLSARTDDAQESTSLLWELGRVYSLAVHPYRGFLYFSTYDSTINTTRLMRLNTDAKNLTVLLGLKEATFISIDYSRDKLYVINGNTSEILCSTLNGQKIRKIGPPGIAKNATGFLVHNGIIYLKNRSSIKRFDALTGKQIDELNIFPYDRDMSVDLRIHSLETFKLDIETNPCTIDNGGCDNFCFAVPKNNTSFDGLKKICKCYDGINCKVKIP